MYVPNQPVDETELILSYTIGFSWARTFQTAGVFFHILSECVLCFSVSTLSTADQTSRFIQEKHQQFPLDLRVTTVEQCPCMALKVRMTEAKRNLSKAESPSAHIMHTACQHLISAHCSKATAPSSDHSSNIPPAPPPLRPRPVKAQLQ